MADNVEQVLLELDPRSINAIVDGISRAFTVAFTDANKIVVEQMRQMSRDMQASFAVAQKEAAKAAKVIGADFKEAGSTGSTAFEKMVDSFTANLVSLKRATGVIVSELQRVSQLERRSSIDATQAASDAARLQIAEVRNVGIQTNIEGQKAVVVARGAAKSRVLITQGMVRSIVLLEKGIGTAISGIARTAVSAFSKIFSGITGKLRGGTSGVDAEMRRTSQAVERGMRKTNSEFTTGVQGALNKREGLLRSSFRDQEQIISRSALRQKETLAGLRTGTQTGVLGAANRGLNIGALVGGAAIFQGIRSTFSIGSEFTRGMAVLQAQLDLTGGEMKKVRQLSIDLGNDITLPGVSALNAGEAIQLLAKQFAALGSGAITAAEDAAKGTLQLSRAAAVSAEEAAGIVGNAVNVFGVGADKATDVADQVTAALKNAAGVSFGDFADAFKQGAGVFASYQKEAVGGTEALVEFNTALAVMARNALVGSDAGTSLKQFFLQANRGTDASKEALIELTERAGETGTAFFDASEKARPFEQTLDILRRGLKGMTDQQRTSTIQTIFGSDASRAANALLGVSTEEYHKVTQSLREQGLAAKIAAAQNTGLKGALDALKSVMETVQILLFEKVNPFLGKFVLALAAAVNVVLFGKGAWATLRQGLLGVAAGLGAILAVKGVIEIFSQLGRVVALVATPFGAFLAIAALVGGAVFILAKHSESFREALRSLRERLEDFAGVAKDRVVTALHNIRDVIVRDVIPFLKELGKWVGGHLVGAFRATIRFIEDKAIPALKTAGLFIGRIASIGFKAVVNFIREHAIPAFQAFVHFVTGTVIPIAIQVGDILAGAFDTALDAVQRFWHWVEPVLRPLLDGFKELGGAIAAIFTGGDFSQLGRGFSAVGSGIATSFTGIGKNLLGVLDRLWITLKEWLKRNFSGPNLISLGKGFLDLVEWIGHTLGAIVTSPTFVRAVAITAAGLAAAAVLIAGRFIEGFGKAFLDNLPGLLDLIGGAILDGIIAVFQNPLIAIGIGLAIAGILRAVSIVKGFSAAGAQAGGGFFKGFAASLATSARGLPGLFNGLFLGPNGIRAKLSGDAQVAARQEAGALQRQLRAFGSVRVISPSDSASVLKGNRAELKFLTRDLSDAQMKGLLLRDSFRQFGKIGTTVFRDLRGAATLFGTSLRENFALQRALSKPIKDDPFLLLGKNTGPRFQAIGEQVRQLARTTNLAFDGIRLRGMQAFDSVKTSVKVAANTATTSGRMMARSFNLAFDGIRLRGMSVLDGLKSSVVGRTASAGASAFGTAFSKGFTAIKTAFGTALDGLRTAAVERGTTVGKLVASSIVNAVRSGMVTAAAAVGGFLAGKAEGERGGSGVASALLGGLTAGAITGSPIIGAVTAVATLVGAHFGKAAKKVKEFNDEVKRLVGLFRDDLVNAIETGQIAIDGLSFADVFGAGGNEDKIRKDFIEKLSGALSIDQADIFAGTGLTLDVDIIPLVKASGGNKARFDKSLQTVFGEALAKSPQFVNLFGKVDPDEVISTLKAVSLAGSGAQQKFAVDTLKVVDTLLKEGDAAVAALAVIELLAPAIVKVPPVDIVGGDHLHDFETLDELNARAKTLGQTITNTANNGAMKKLNNDAALAAIQFLKLGTPIEDLNDKLAKAHLPPIPDSIINDWTKQLGRAQTKAEELRAVVEGLPDDFAKAARAALNLPTTVTAAQAVVDVKADIGSLHDSIVDAAGDVTKPEVVLALANLGDTVGSAVGKAITDHVVVDPASLQTFLTDLQTQALAGIDDPATKDAINAAFLQLFAGLVVKLPDGIGAVAGADLAAQVNAYMLANPFVTQIQAEFVVSLKPVVGEGALGTRRQGLVAPEHKSLLDGLLPTAADIASLQTQAGDAIRPVGEFLSTSFADSIKSPASHAVVEGATKIIVGAPVRVGHDNSGAMRPVGESFSTGFARGINSPTSRAAIIAASTAAARLAIDNAKKVLAIGSPSKVMMEVGGFVAEGFARGITDGSAAAATAAEAAVQAAVDAARGVANANPISLGLDVPVPQSLRFEDPVAKKGRDVAQAANQGLPQTQIGVGVSVIDAARIAAEFARIQAKETGAAVIDRANLGARVTPGADTSLGAFTASSGAVADAARQAIEAATAVLEAKIPAAFRMEDPVAAKGRGVATGARIGFDTSQAIGVDVIQRAQLGTRVNPGDDAGALKTHKELADLVTLARSLVATAQALNKRGPDVTNVAITEAKDARSTARATIAELRADRLLMKGYR